MHPNIYAFTLRSLKNSETTPFFSPSTSIFPLSGLHCFRFHFNIVQHYLTLSFRPFIFISQRLFQRHSHYHIWLKAFRKQNENCLKSNAFFMECRAKSLASFHFFRALSFRQLSVSIYSPRTSSSFTLLVPDLSAP